MKAVLDTNVLISGMGWSGRERRLLLAASDRYELVLSHEILEELISVLQRDKFKCLNSKKILQFIEILTDISMTVEPKKHHKVISDDPDDDMILDCAVEAKASYIVSGDKHLLALGEFKDIRILKPSEFEKLIFE